MDDSIQRLRVEELDWPRLFPFLRLFESFRMAVHPTKLLLALQLVVLLWVGGQLLNVLWGARVYPGEFDQYARAGKVEDFHQWVEVQRKWQSPEQMEGIFQTAWHQGVGSFQRLVTAALQLRLGLDPLGRRGMATDPDSVVGAMYEMAVTLPGWLWHAHRWFFIFYFMYVVLVWSLLGGAIARLAALEATRDQRATAMEAMRYVAGRWAWFVFTPLMPMIFMCLLSLVPVLGGFVFFNLPVLDVVGAFLFAVALFCGAAIAGIVLLAAGAKHLFYPALAVEGTDGFDAISRSFAYLLGKPWRWLFYNVTALVYGAITYLFVATIVFLTLWITQRCVGTGVLREENGVGRFEAIFPVPEVGDLAYEPKWESLGVSGKISAAMVSAWVYLVIGVTAAFAISFYFNINTWIYLLLRRCADGTEFDEVFVESNPQQEPAPGAAPAPDSGAAPEAAPTAGGEGI